ncbi:MAG: helix-turn-helix domain-containing protein [Myxococcales bacterium]|nr:helix-turn-helix domain-containing protein [Myxococcales bacterium]
MGLDFRHLQQIEAGTVNVTLATILRICDAFGVTPSILLPFAKETKPKLGPPRVLRVLAIRAAEPPGFRPRPTGAGQFLANPIERPPEAETAEAQKLVGSAIKRARKLKALTQRKLAEAMNVSVQYLQAVEGGKQNLTIESILKFARALGVDRRELW